MSEGTYIPENQRDTSWWIWNKKFMCRVPYLQTMSSDYIRHFGIMVSGDPVRDRAITSEMITTMLSINQMVEYFQKGITVGVVNYADTKKIYEYISDHLTAWRQRLEHGLNVRDAPLDDLVVMDRFAAAVYQHARHLFDEAFVEGILARSMMGSMRLNRTSFTKRLEPTPEKPKDSEDPHAHLPERNSMSEVFASHRITTPRQRWK